MTTTLKKMIQLVQQIRGARFEAHFRFPVIVKKKRKKKESVANWNLRRRDQSS